MHDDKMYVRQRVSVIVNWIGTSTNKKVQFGLSRFNTIQRRFIVKSVRPSAIHQLITLVLAERKTNTKRVHIAVVTYLQLNKKDIISY